MGERDDGWRESEIKRLNKQKTVNVPAMVELHQWLDEARRYRQSGRIIGDSQTGKTVACEQFCFNLCEQVSSQPGRPTPAPVLYTPLFENCGQHDLFERILTGLHFRFQRGRLADVRTRVYSAMTECRVEEWIIDEGQRLHSSALSEVRDLRDRLKLAIVLVGTQRLNTVLRRDEQVYNRFPSQYTYDRLDGERFEQVVGLLEEKVLRLPVASNLTSTEMLTLLQGMSHGLLGRLDFALRKAARIALETHKDRIDREILVRVARDMY